MAENEYTRSMSESKDSGVTFPRDATSKAKIPPIGYTNHRPGADPTREYVSGHTRLFVSQFIQSLPQYIDDTTRDLGSDLYERMQYDSQIFSLVSIFKAAILADGYKISPRIEDPKNPRYEKAKWYSDFFTSMVENLEEPFDLFLYEMLDGVATGHRVAEQILEVDDYGDYKGYWSLKKLKIKPRGTTSFVVDAWYNIVGLLALIPGSASPLISGHIMSDPNNVRNLLPRSKFCVFTFNPKDNDPRGRSILRPAYTPWWSKQQLWGEWLSYMAKYGTPSMWGTTPPNAQARPALDSDGNPTSTIITTPEEAMVSVMESLRNGSFAAFPYASQINAIPVGPNGDVYISGMDFCDRQASKAILSQTLATEEGEHMARASAEVHQDIMDIGVRHGKRMMSKTVENDLFRNIMRWNFGEGEARELTPFFSLSQTAQVDWGKVAGIVTSLYASGYLSQEQIPELDKKLGLSPRNTPPMGQQQQEQGGDSGGQQSANGQDGAPPQQALDLVKKAAQSYQKPANFQLDSNTQELAKRFLESCTLYV